MQADQAIYTSLQRQGREGYHVVSRSRGVSDSEARVLASWSPSHGGLILDEWNWVSLNIHPVSDRRIALSRTCEGRPEYSGRGGRQIYTHALLFDISQIEQTGFNLLGLYRDGLALGHFRYRVSPETVLEPAELGCCHRPISQEAPASRGPELESGALEELRQRFLSGEPAQFRYQGDRILLAARLLARLPVESLASLSLSTSLHPSPSRPYRLSLIG